MEEIEIIVPLIVMVIYFAIFIFALLSSLVTSIIYGVTIGAIPLVCGLMNGKKTIGIVGFLVCFATYWMLGLFPALLACLLFIVFILKEKKAVPTKETAAEEVNAEK